MSTFMRRKLTDQELLSLVLAEISLDLRGL
jgi:hypothetical protein